MQTNSSFDRSQKIAIIPHIVEQHAEEAAFLWLLRDTAVRAPHYSLKDLAELDERIEAHLDGIRVNGDEAWEICLAGLQHKEPGEVFAAGVLAFERMDGIGIDAVTKAAQITQENFRALISALGWLSRSVLDDWSQRLLAANYSLYSRLGIAACAVHRKDPGKALEATLKDTDQAPQVQARALRAVGELKRRDLLPLLRQRLQADDENIRFWAAWSATLLGDKSALQAILWFVNNETPFHERAMQLALRVLDSSKAHDWLKRMAQDADLHRDVLLGIGIFGDPVYVPSLITKMEEPELARVAGEAFSMITGVDLAYEDLEGEWPEGFEVGPTENLEDEDVGMDPDEDLPWPEPKLVRGWWEKNKGRFITGTRYLCGQPITAEHCKRILLNGYQRQRNAAAFELALILRDHPLFETRARGDRQQRFLERGIK